MALGKASGTYKALRLTPAYALTTGWPPHFPSVSALLGFRSDYPDFKDFVRSLQLWQGRQPGLKADGILGPRTWKRMEPLVLAYTGDKPRGQYPDWFLSLSNEVVAAGLRLVERQGRRALLALAESRRGSHQPRPCRSDRSAEDELMQEMARVAVQQKLDPDHAIEVSADYARHAARLGQTSVDTQSQLGVSILGTIKVGQVWPGVQGGTRIVVALAPTFDQRAQAMSCDIVFVTPSGRCYAQPLRGWAQDYATLLIDDVNRKLAPLKVMLETEAAFLLGALSAVNPVLGGLSLASTILAWWGDPRNREIMAVLIAGYGVLMLARDELRKLAPTVYDKVCNEALGRVLNEIPGAAARDPRTLATFVAQMTWTLGRVVITRDFARGLEGLWLVARWIWAVLQPAIGVTTATAGAAAGSVPAAATAAARTAAREVADDIESRIRAFKEQGIAITRKEAEAMLREIRQNPQRIKAVLERLKSTLDQLVVAMAGVA